MPNCAPVTLGKAAPCPAHTVLASGSCAALRKASMAAACTSGGVPLGAHRPYQVCTSYAGRPTSAALGTSGMAGLRLLPATISALMRPPLMWPADEPRPSNAMSTVPEIKSCSAGPAPR